MAVKKLTYDMADKAMQCKEESDPIPIIKINSVCSMASSGLSPHTEVRSDHHLGPRLCKTLHKISVSKCVGTWFGVQSKSLSQIGCSWILGLWDVCSFVDQVRLDCETETTGQLWT